MFDSFSGSKFYPTKKEISYNIYGELQTKQLFKPTESYLDYLNEKRKYEEKVAFEKLKQRLLYQQKTYGEVDEVDRIAFEAALKRQTDIKWR